MYQEIKTYMEEYFKSYSDFAQDAETMYKMDKYWTEDFKTTAYMQLKGDKYPLEFHDRKTWQDFLVKGHLTIVEILEATDMMIDTERLMVAAKLRIRKFAKESDQLLCDMDGLGYYQLQKKEDGGVVISSLDFYCGDPSVFSNLYER